MTNVMHPFGCTTRRRTGIKLELISFGESAVANQCASDAGEHEEVVGFALVAAVEPAASGRPGHGALYLPAVVPQLFGGLHARVSQTVHDSAPVEPSAQVIVAIAFVTVQLGRFAPPGAKAEPGRGNPLHQGLEGCRG